MLPKKRLVIFKNELDLTFYMFLGGGTPQTGLGQKPLGVLDTGSTRLHVQTSCCASGGLHPPQSAYHLQGPRLLIKETFTKGFVVK